LKNPNLSYRVRSEVEVQKRADGSVNKPVRFRKGTIAVLRVRP
jgi:hypothetical protein